MITRPETNEDIDDVYRLLDVAFGQSTESVLVQKLRATPEFQQGYSLVLDSAQSLIGYLLLYPIIIKNKDHEIASLALAPMAVDPDFQNQGFGSKLVIEAIGVAKSSGWGSIVVLGHPEYYPRFGFLPASQWNITGPFDVPDSVFMALELKPGEIIQGGAVIYPPPFLQF
jgi:predicted N-acetyltransferase YhbS